MKSLALAVVCFVVPAYAVDITTCGQVVNERETGVLQTDLVDCSTGVTLEARATLMLNGHSISGAYIGVECRGAKWAILGPGSIVGGHDGILYTFPGALHPKLTLRDLVIDDNDDVAVAAEGGGRIVADGVEASGNAMGLAASRITGRNLSVTGNGGFGLYSDRLLLRDSTVTGNNGAPGGVDISVYRKPRVSNSTCGLSAGPNGPWGICAGDAAP